MIILCLISRNIEKYIWFRTKKKSSNGIAFGQGVFSHGVNSPSMFVQS